MVSVYKFLTVPKNGFRSMDEVINCMVLRLHFDCVQIHLGAQFRNGIKIFKK